jgi:hypothetical protein
MILDFWWPLGDLKIAVPCFALRGVVALEYFHCAKKELEAEEDAPGYDG